MRCERGVSGHLRTPIPRLVSEVLSDGAKTAPCWPRKNPKHLPYQEVEGIKRSTPRWCLETPRFSWAASCCLVGMLRRCLSTSSGMHNISDPTARHGRRHAGAAGGKFMHENVVLAAVEEILTQQSLDRSAVSYMGALMLSLQSDAGAEPAVYAGVLKLLERALAIQEREYGPDHREVAVTLTNLGNAYGALGDAAKKRELLERALAIKEREYGPEHRELGDRGGHVVDLGVALGGPAPLRRGLRLHLRLQLQHRQRWID
mgnify:CR=1 FL=1